jgi:5,5'-dehydrodivanillate O-demethylase
VRLLGEDLVLYRDRSGALGLIAEFCPHRHASFYNGIPTSDGIRCAYHGWKFDGTGACIEQPNEPEGSTFKDKVHIAGYPVEALGAEGDVRVDEFAREKTAPFDATRTG